MEGRKKKGTERKEKAKSREAQRKIRKRGRDVTEPCSLPCVW